MYSSGQVLRGLRNPDLIRQELNTLYYRRGNTWAYNEAGMDVFEADWDNLIVLDACRYDLFARRHTLSGRLERRQSRASSTKEFLRANFEGRELHDVVYVTANPQLARKGIDTSLHAVRNVWQDEGWDDHYRTVHPETMTTWTLRAAHEFPDKRLVAHYMQPHYPFIGPTGLEHFELDTLAFWSRFKRGEIDVPDDVIERAYRENLDVALPYVTELLEGLEGKTVVTADHGELFGERAGIVPKAYYGHPSGVYHEDLVTVPWLVHDAGPRKETRPEPPVSNATPGADEETVRSRLRDLGYVG
jgi:hypothetical protein